VTRSRMRSVVLLAAATAAAAGLISGCGAGQVSQTAIHEAAVNGLNADSADRLLRLRDLQIVYREKGYPQGGSAPISVRIFNTGPAAVTLTGVTSDAGTVVLTGTAATTSPSPAASPTSPSPAASPTSPSPSPNGRSPSPTGSPSPTAASSPSPGAPGSTQINVAIPTDGFVMLSPEATRYLQLTGLSRALRPGDSVPMTFRFDNGTTITASVPFGVPMSPLPRSPMDLHETDTSGEGPGH
jgi:copper(I)-binding protein